MKRRYIQLLMAFVPELLIRFDIWMKWAEYTPLTGESNASDKLQLYLELRTQDRVNVLAG